MTHILQNAEFFLVSTCFKCSYNFKKLTQNCLPGVYNLFYCDYFQASQSEHLQQVAEKSKKKDRKISTSIAMAGKVNTFKNIKFSSITALLNKMQHKCHVLFSEYRIVHNRGAYPNRRAPPIL